MNALEWVAREVEMLFGPDDVHLFTVVESLTNEWDVHETEESDVPASELFRTAERALCLPIEGTLAKD